MIAALSRRLDCKGPNVWRQLSIISKNLAGKSLGEVAVHANDAVLRIGLMGRSSAGLTHCLLGPRRSDMGAGDGEWDMRRCGRASQSDPPAYFPLRASAWGEKRAWRWPGNAPLTCTSIRSYVSSKLEQESVQVRMMESGGLEAEENLRVELCHMVCVSSVSQVLPMPFLAACMLASASTYGYLDAPCFTAGRCSCNGHQCCAIYHLRPRWREAAIT